MTSTHDSTADWPRTIWSEAAQINRLNGRRPPGVDRARPPEYFRWLREAGHDHEAALFIAQALSRYEAVAWAAGVISRAPGAEVTARSTLTAIDAWLADPGETNRRAVGEHAINLAPASAETLCALAVFHSGGSIAPPYHAPVPPPRGAVGRFAGVAVIAAAARAKRSTNLLGQALDEGARLASRLEIAP